MAEHNKLGVQGEKIAINYLISKGYEILHTNWRHRHLELDIIAQNEEYLIVIEVKTRSSIIFKDIKDTIDNKKIRHIVNATQCYIFEHNIQKEVRFDMLAILSTPTNEYKIEHIEDAFLAPIN